MREDDARTPRVERALGRAEVTLAFYEERCVFPAKLGTDSLGRSRVLRPDVPVRTSETGAISAPIGNQPV